MPTKLISAGNAERDASYRAQNAFGANANVSRTRYMVHRWGLGQVRYGSDDWVEDFSLSFKVEVTPDQAPLAISRLRVVVAGELDYPRIRQTVGDIMIPTISRPIDSKTAEAVIVAPPICAALVDSSTNRVLSQQRISVYAKPK